MTVHVDLGEQRAASPSRGRDYRAFTTCIEPAPWLPALAGQVASWLRQKNWDVDVNADGVHWAPDGHGSLSIRHHKHGQERALQAVLEEENPSGHWTTRVTAVENERSGGWFRSTYSAPLGSSSASLASRGSSPRRCTYTTALGSCGMRRVSFGHRHRGTRRRPDRPSAAWRRPCRGHRHAAGLHRIPIPRRSLGSGGGRPGARRRS